MSRQNQSVERLLREAISQPEPPNRPPPAPMSPAQAQLAAEVNAIYREFVQATARATDRDIERALSK